MNLQFADLNNDGHNDIVTATFEGTAMVVYGSKDGWKPQEHIVDSQGRNIVLSLYYDTVANNYSNADRSPTGQKNAEDHCVSTTVYDWDNDGDLDLLVGAKEGRLYLQKNLGTASNPKFEGVNHLLQAGDSEFMIPGGLTAVRPYDWDKDGDDDFLCGSFKGGLYLVENIGKTGAIELAAPVKLLGNELTMGGKTVDSINWYADPVDYDNDGKTDLLVGMHVSKPIEKKVLTKEEEAEYEQAQKRIQEINKISQERTKPLRDLPREEQMAAFKELNKDEEFKKMSEEMRTLFQRTNELRPRPQHTPSVWLYKGK